MRKCIRSTIFGWLATGTSGTSTGKNTCRCRFTGRMERCLGISKIIPQLNRAIKYIPYVLSRAAGAPGRSSPKGGAGREDGANNTSAASGPTARVVGHDTHTGMMILALATRHRVERPAMGMEGGTLNPMERPCPSPFEMPLIYDCELENPHRSTVRILSYQRRHRLCKG